MKAEKRNGKIIITGDRNPNFQDKAAATQAAFAVANYFVSVGQTTHLEFYPVGKDIEVTIYFDFDKPCSTPKNQGYDSTWYEIQSYKYHSIIDTATSRVRFKTYHFTW